MICLTCLEEMGYTSQEACDMYLLNAKAVFEQLGGGGGLKGSNEADSFMWRCGIEVEMGI